MFKSPYEMTERLTRLPYPPFKFVLMLTGERPPLTYIWRDFQAPHNGNQSFTKYLVRIQAILYISSIWHDHRFSFTGNSYFLISPFLLNWLQYTEPVLVSHFCNSKYKWVFGAPSFRAISHGLLQIPLLHLIWNPEGCAIWLNFCRECCWVWMRSL